MPRFHRVPGLTADITAPAILKGVQSPESVGEPAIFQQAAGEWRRQGQAPKFRAGLLVIDNALGSLNPSCGHDS
jgi:hypothetical protein